MMRSSTAPALRLVEPEAQQTDSKPVYQFGDFELDARQFVLRCCGEPVGIDAKTFDLLRFLIENRERVVSKEEILDSVWGYCVGEAVITTNVKEARRILGDTRQAQIFIRTIRGVGYQFVAPVQVQQAESDRPYRPTTVLRAKSRASVLAQMRGLLQNFSADDSVQVILVVGDNSLADAELH